MTYCSKCSTTLESGAKFCPVCGEAVENKSAASPENLQPETSEVHPEYSKPSEKGFSALNDTKDESDSFDAADVEKNKFMAVLAYIIFLIPLIAAKESPFARYHTNQGIILVICAVIVSVISAVPVIGWIIAPVAGIAVTVFAIIGILNALNGKAKELPIIGKFRILK